MTITAAVDGSSLGNPGPAGWAWVVNQDCWDAGGWPEGTNNLGELTAVLELLKATQAAGLAAQELHILADSQYAINVVSKWRLGWKKRGWTKADKKPIKNLELIQEIDRAIEGRHVTFEWVKGHAGHALNEEADDFARGCAEAYQAGRTPQPGPGFSAASDSQQPDTPLAAETRTFPPSTHAPSPETADTNTPETHTPDIEAAEKAFITAWTSGDNNALATMTQPDATRIWPSGHTTPTMAGPAPANLKVSRINITTLAPTAWLTHYQIRWDGGSALESSVWVTDEDEASPRLAHHQSTPAPQE